MRRPLSQQGSGAAEIGRIKIKCRGKLAHHLRATGIKLKQNPGLGQGESAFMQAFAQKADLTGIETVEGPDIVNLGDVHLVSLGGGQGI